jgi:hypothetical protein
LPSRSFGTGRCLFSRFTGSIYAFCFTHGRQQNRLFGAFRRSRRIADSSAHSLVGIRGVQVAFGFATFLTLLIVSQNTPALVVISAAHITNGALTLAVSVVMMIQIRYRVRGAANARIVNRFFASAHFANVPSQQLSARLYSAFKNPVRAGAYPTPDKARENCQGSFSTSSMSVNRSAAGIICGRGPHATRKASSAVVVSSPKSFFRPGYCVRCARRAAFFLSR